MTVVGDDGVDPVAQQGPQPHQRHPVAQQRPQLAHRRRGDPRLRQQVRPQQLGEIAASALSFFSRAEAIALHRDGCTRCGANP